MPSKGAATVDLRLPAGTLTATRRLRAGKRVTLKITASDRAGKALRSTLRVRARP